MGYTRSVIFFGYSGKSGCSDVSGILSKVLNSSKPSQIIYYGYPGLCTAVGFGHM